MSEWMSVQIGDNITMVSGFPFDSGAFDEVDGLPLIRIRDLPNTVTECRYRGRFDERYLIHTHDILIGMDGDFAIVKWKGERGLLNQRLLKIEQKQGSVIDIGFLYFYLVPFLQGVNRATAATTVKHLSLYDISNATIRIPSRPEQGKIARILTTVDNLIEKTEALMVKYESIKQGMMHDLFTRGIDEKGRLRPSYEEAPELYKRTKLGWLPRDWEVQPIEMLLGNVDPAMRSGPFGSSLLKSELVEVGIPLLGIDNVYVERFDNNYTRFVTTQKFNELIRYRVHPHDVMITIMGTVGRCCVVPEDIGDALSSKHVWTLTFDRSKYSPFLACLQFNHAPWILERFRRDEQGGVMSAIRSETLRTASFPVPPSDEMHRIESNLVSIAKKIDAENALLSKFRLLKSGLMHDLLTGKMRVQVEEAEQCT